MILLNLLLTDSQFSDIVSDWLAVHPPANQESDMFENVHPLAVILTKSLVVSNANRCSKTTHHTHYLILNIYVLSNLYMLHQISKLKWFSSCLAVVFAQSIEARCQVENKDVVGAAPIDDASTTSEWSTSLLPTNVRLISEDWLCRESHCGTTFSTIHNEARPWKQNLGLILKRTKSDLYHWHLLC